MQFSNEDKDVFLVKIDRMIDRGALLSRYSRAASLDIRDVYRKEFAGNEDRGKDFYKRVFLEYGDESIAELVTAQIAVQNLSNVMTKAIEELRVGLSYLEKSSRYVRYDKKVDGRYLYLLPEKAGMAAEMAGDYTSLCDSLFDFYSSSYDQALEYYRKKYPLEEIRFDEGREKPLFIEDLDEQGRADAEKSYRSSIRARALDDLRFLLPASTLTNLGISGNGRAFINLVQKLKSIPAPEAEYLSNSIYGELEPELPELINSAVSQHGLSLIEYKKTLDSAAVPGESSVGGRIPLVELLDYEDGHEALRKSLSLLSFANGSGDLKSIMQRISSSAIGELERVIGQLAEMRTNRRHKIHRAFESVPYLFQITTNYGAFRDLQRHRFISINRQPLSDMFGYDTPPFFAETEAGSGYAELMKESSKLYRRIREHSGKYVAQYVIPYSYRYQVSAYLNLREATFFCELRSTPQAHPDLREIAKAMHDEIRRVNPELSRLMKFVDHGEYALGRLRAEQRKERRMRELDNDTH